MDSDRHKIVSSVGGKRAHKLGRLGRPFTPATAKEAGAKGGKQTASTPGHMLALQKQSLEVRRKKAVTRKPLSEPAVDT